METLLILIASAAMLIASTLLAPGRRGAQRDVSRNQSPADSAGCGAGAGAGND